MRCRVSKFSHGEVLRITISVLHDDGNKSGGAGGILDEGGRRDDSSVMMVQYSTVQYYANLPIQIER